MEDNWIKIYTSGNFHQSELVRQVLIENKVNAVLLNKQDNSYRFGEIEVYINRTDFDQAIELIIKNEL